MSGANHFARVPSIRIGRWKMASKYFHSIPHLYPTFPHPAKGWAKPCLLRNGIRS
jgi:hypothetical protein